GNPVSGAKHHHHGLANDTPESEQDRRHNTRKGGRHDDASDGLKPICTKRIGGLDKTAWNITESVLSQSENCRHRHEGKEGAGGENVEPLRNWKKSNPMQKAGL